MNEESLRSALRDRTRELHARLDTALVGPGGRVAGVAGYVRVLTVLHALHARVDAPLRRWVTASPLAEGLDPALLPDRATAYAADLRALGVAVETTQPAPEPVGDARGLASLYLLAGSAAGARVLLRDLPDTVPAEARCGLTDAAGSSSTTFWRQTCALLSRPVDTVLCEAVVAEARDAFQLMIAGKELVAS